MKTHAPFALCGLVLAGCTVPVAAGVDESDANRIVVSLDHASIDATKEADPQVEGHFRVMVMRDDAARALVTMQGEGLPVANARGSASVLIEHRGSTPPITVTHVQQIVAGGVPTLAPAAVAVVMVPRFAAPGSDGLQLAHAGPIAVARTSMRALQLALVGLLALVAVLAGATLALYTRLARLREGGAPAKP